MICLAVSKTVSFPLNRFNLLFLLHTVSWLSTCNSLLSWCSRFFCRCDLWNCGWFAVLLPQMFAIGICSFSWTVHTVLSAAPFHLRIACCVKDPVTVVFVRIILSDYLLKWCPLKFWFYVTTASSFSAACISETAETDARRSDIFTRLKDSDKDSIVLKEWINDSCQVLRS